VMNLAGGRVRAITPVGDRRFPRSSLLGV